jgi:hypothetical protein
MLKLTNPINKAGQSFKLKKNISNAVLDLTFELFFDNKNTLNFTVYEHIILRHRRIKETGMEE